MMAKVAIIGAGTMGHSFAMLFAQGGHQVNLQDISDDILARADRFIAAGLETMALAGLFDLQERPEVMSRIQYTTDLAQAVAGVDLVVEAIIEDVQAKKDLFGKLDKLAPPEAVLASNTSYLDIYQFVEISRPERLIITHWFAPPHIVPLVEVVPGSRTSPDTVAFCKKILEDLGKTVIVLKKYLPGFIANRLQAAINLEVLNLLDNGYATAEEIDAVVKSSIALRMPFIGVVQRFDFTGIDMIQRSLRNKSYQPPEVRGRSDKIDELVDQGRMGVVSGKGFYDYQGRRPDEIMRERDVKLLKLRSFLNKLQ